ncbi:iron ABC transporter permease [Pseudofrankia sp. DC12]|uniref:FecCD family ABC transporter permease n=1 Tax=Pseudofrankia sp. DC12 TaxID=683315 RepID=UPI0009FBD184|nr:iron ABC transporter permease [Pseudofrankia sp. DC12]
MSTSDVDSAGHLDATFGAAGPPAIPPVAAVPPADRPTAQSRLSEPARFAVVLTVLVVATPLVLAMAVSLGAVRLPLGEVWSSVLGHTIGPVAGRHPTPGVDDEIIWQVRVPRVLLAFVVGAGLSVAGAALQAVVRNPLADPYVLGVSSGASLAAVAVLTLGGAGGVGWLSSLGVAGAAFAGGMLTLAAVLLLGRRDGRVDPYRLLLAGVALGYLLTAGTSYLQLRVSSNQLAHLLFWLLGMVSGADWHKLGLPAATVAAATGWLILRGRALNALLLGDDVAASAGVAVSALRTELLVIAALLTGTVIAVAGGVQFVGLIAPHAVRLLVGGDHRRLLPLAALLGGDFLVAADLAARTVTEPLELPLTIVTAAAGVPFFLVLLRRGGLGGAR